MRALGGRRVRRARRHADRRGARALPDLSRGDDPRRRDRSAGTPRRDHRVAGAVARRRRVGRGRRQRGRQCTHAGQHRVGARRVPGALAYLAAHVASRRHCVAPGSAGILALLALWVATSAASKAECLLAVYALYAWTLSSEERPPAETERSARGAGCGADVLRVVVGLGVVLLGADLVVKHALVLATSLQWDQTVIGIFIVGAGTSLPELALSLNAAIRGRAALALGNIIGSNVFDLLVPVGVSAVIHPLAIDGATLRFDLPALAILTLFGLARLVRHRRLGRGDALVLVAGYLVYAFVRLTYS